MKPSSSFLGVISAVTLTVTSHAQVLQEWQFNDTAGTLASEATLGVPGGPAFTSDIGSTATTGAGALRIQRDIGESQYGQAFLDTSLPRHLQIDLVISGWNFSGTASERFRIGFTNGTGTLQTADFELERTGEDEISMRTVAFGTGADAGSDVVIPGLGNVREDPVYVRLEYDGINNQYNTQYDIGDGWVSLLVGGTAVNNTSSDRNAGAVRLYATNAFSGTGEYFDVDSVTLSQIPEPSTYAFIFGGIALAAAFVYRRRSGAAGKVD